MTCVECERIQDEALVFGLRGNYYYFRIMSSNVMVLCCPMHAKILQEKLRDAEIPRP